MTEFTDTKVVLCLCICTDDPHLLLGSCAVHLMLFQFHEVFKKPQSSVECDFVKAALAVEAAVSLDIGS